MNQCNDAFCKDNEWLYKKFASDNQVDYLQLCILDTARNCGGSITWNALRRILPFSRLVLMETAQILEEDGLIKIGPDFLSVTEFGYFETEDMLAQLHRQLDVVLNPQPEEPEELMYFDA